MRRVFLLVAAACGGSAAVPDGAPAPDAVSVDGSIDTPPPCPAPSLFARRPTNPRLVAGQFAYADGMRDIAVSDPDLRWDGAAWSMYFHGPHAASFSGPGTGMVRHATSADLQTWSIDETPSLVASSDPDAWDHQNTETPSVVYDGTRYVLAYSGAHGTFPGWSFPDYAIGIAFSDDGHVFTRVPAAESPHGQPGLVLTGPDVYGQMGIVADPELAFVDGTYHLWFSSFACTGTDCQTVTAFGVAHATSTDAIHWTIAEAPVRSLLRDANDPTTGGAQPSVVVGRCGWELWQTSDLPGDTQTQPIVFNNMAGVWHATSDDGATWSIDYGAARDLAWTPSAPGEHLGLLTGADVAARGDARYMMYGAFDDQNVPAGYFLPDRSQQGYEPGVMTLDLATRDAP
jgi:hypothetical protein